MHSVHRDPTKRLAAARRRSMSRSSIQPGLAEVVAADTQLLHLALQRARLEPEAGRRTVGSVDLPARGPKRLLDREAPRVLEAWGPGGQLAARASGGILLEGPWV